MTILHPQEKLLEVFDFNGAAVELVEWSDTLWCGRIGYAADNSGEPDVGAVMSGFRSLDTASARERESDWDVCMSVNYLSDKRPNGLLVGFQVMTADQPDCFDVYKAPFARYMRLLVCDGTAAALGREPWHGGIPPFGWIGELAAPRFGYKYGCDRLPIFEYYGFYDPKKNAHRYCYLYVPVEKS